MTFAGRIAMLCALLFMTLGATGSSEDLARLLDRMRGAAGPVWSTHLVSVSRLIFEGEPSVVSSESLGLPVTLRRCTGEVCSGTYFDGNRLYSFDLNGTTLPLSAGSEPYLRSMRIVASLEFLSPGFIGRGGRIVDFGLARLHGVLFRTIVVADKESIPMRLFIDPGTNLVRYARDYGGNDTFEFLNYRRVGGFRLPFEVLHDGKPFDSYDDRTPVSSAYHAPHGPQPAPRSGSDVATTVPTDPNAVEPIVDCSVGGVSVRCLVDTGNSGLSMSSELASRLGAPVVGAYQVRGLGGYSTQVVRAGSTCVGGLCYPEAYYIVLNDLRHYGYDVVLGADVFGSTNVVIDQGAHVIRFGAALDEHAIVVPLAFERFVPVVRVGLGDLETNLAVDTGDESNINLAYDFYEKHTGLFDVTTRRQVGGIGGTSVELIGEIGNVTIGGYRMGPQRIGTTQTLQGTASGHLGAAFLAQFVAGFDYANAVLHLTPRRS